MRQAEPSSPGIGDWQRSNWSHTFAISLRSLQNIS
uniref:Bm1319 n=1 Tax=Brugia malayi TaxID=6279 RepID=A0A1I9G282_BRUMA|nr:Bm1319 [Brugia malayi]